MNKQKPTNWGAVYSKLVKLADPATRSRVGLSMAEKAIMEAIAEHMGQKRTAWPGYGTIAHFAGCDRSTAIRTVKTLVERKILRVVEEPGQDSNHYEIDAKAIGKLITNTKYQQRAAGYLRRVAAESAPSEQETPSLNDRTSSTVPPGWWQDATTVVAGRHQGGGTVPPERPSERPPNRSKNDPGPESRERSSSRKGERQGDDSPSVGELIRNEEVSRLTLEVETELLATTHFNHHTLLSPDSVAARVAKLWADWKGELGRYPEPWMVASVVNTSQFQFKNLNWGLLTSTKPTRKGSPPRARLFKAVVDQFRDHRASRTPATNSADTNPARVKEGRGHWTDIDGTSDLDSRSYLESDD